MGLDRRKKRTYNAFYKSDEEKSRFFGLLQRAPAAEKGCRKES